MQLHGRHYKNKAELCSKAFCVKDRLRLFEAVVSPVALYACSTWALKKGMEKDLHATWRRMLRYIFGIHRFRPAGAEPGAWPNFLQRAARKVKELAAKFGAESWAKTYRRRKWRFAGRLARVNDERWCRRVLHCQPESQRSRQRPLTRWSDQLVHSAGGSWIEIAADPEYWTILEEGFVNAL